MDWNLEGRKVAGHYMGMQEFMFTGTVSNSRVRYGGSVSHTVELDTPIYVHGDKRERLICGNLELTKVLDNSASLV